MKTSEMERLIGVVANLRDPLKGCPWDLRQTHESLIRYLIEESYECIDALQSGDPVKSEEELGDVLLQIILHSQIASEKSQYNIESVAKKIADKLIKRHPHVFNNPTHKKFSEDEIHENWQKEKTKEGKVSHQTISGKDNLFPALQSAFVIGEKSKKFNFDWENYQQVLLKVEEELAELKAELASSAVSKQKKIEEELGDLLFSVSQLARHLKLNPEEVLHKANAKFIKRFQSLQELVSTQGDHLEQLNLEQMESYWRKVKKNESKK